MNNFKKTRYTLSGLPIHESMIENTYRIYYIGFYVYRLSSIKHIYASD